MKRIISIGIFVLAVLFSIYTVVSRGQTPQEPQITYKPTFEQKQEKKRLHWSARNESEFASSFEFTNGTEMIERSALKNETALSASQGKYTFTIKPTIYIPTSREQNKIVSSIDLSATRYFNKFEVKASGQYLNSRYRKFAVAGLEASRIYELAEETSIKPFSNFSFYIPTESTNNFVSSGAVWRSGATFEGKLGFTKLELSGQAIADSGAIYEGKRFGINTEVTCFVTPLRNLNFGPRFRYTYFPYLGDHNGLERRNFKSFGFVIAIR